MEVNKTQTSTGLTRRNDMEATMTISDVAKVLQLANSTIYKYAEDGKIPSIKVGKSRRFLRDDIQSYLLSLKNPTDTEKQGEKDEKKTK
jgi:PTS system nitrogen regulatory IIA component